MNTSNLFLSSAFKYRARYKSAASTIVILFCIFCLPIPTNANVLSDLIDDAADYWGEKFAPQPNSITRIEGSFEDLYPTPFWKTKTGKFIAIASTAIVVGTLAYITGGGGLAAAGPMATWIGTQVGMLSGVGSGATAAGLALLGGGSIVSGGLGIAGGLAVIAVVTDVGIMMALDGIADKIPDDEKKYSLLRIPVPVQGKEEVIDLLEKANDQINELNQIPSVKEGQIRIQSQKIRNTYKDTLDKLHYINPHSKTAGYDYIVKAVLHYNFMEFEQARDAIVKATRYTKNTSFTTYLLSLLALTQEQDNALIKASKYLEGSIAADPSARAPYVLKTIVHMDLNEPKKALDIAIMGTKNVEEKYELYWRAAEIAFHNLKQYQRAIELYDEALANTTINELEAQCKVMIAISHRKLGNFEKSREWYEDAKSEVEENKGALETLRLLWDGPITPEL